MRQRHLTFSSESSKGGFSIVEALMAALILVVVTSGSLALYTSYTRSLQLSRRENQVQAALAADIASILRTNRRIVCTTGACTISSTDPTENDYFPDPTNTTFVNYFTSLCSNQTLAAQAATLITNLSPPTEFNTLGITRNAAVAEVYASAPQRSGHRYVVTWSRTVGGQTRPLRQLTLTPTAANWCP